MVIKYEIKGITLNEEDLRKINAYYKDALIAEFLLENYPYINGEEEAMKIAAVAHRLMDKYEFMTEETAISEAIATVLNIKKY